jgi:hypothetical protein
MTSDKMSKADCLLRDVDRLHRLLQCDFAAGHLYWKPRTAQDFDASNYTHSLNRAISVWNTRFAGKRAMLTDGPNGYYSGTLFGASVLTHRVIWVMHTRALVPQGLMLDHINGVKKDNRIENLRLVDIRQNNTNRAVSSSSKSGMKGVSFHAQSGKWHAEVWHEGRSVSLRYHDTVEAAAEAYREASLMLHKEYSVYAR